MSTYLNLFLKTEMEYYFDGLGSCSGVLQRNFINLHIRLFP